MATYALKRLLGLDAYKDKTTFLVETAQQSAYKILLGVTTFSAILWTSVFLYASFYYTYMPAFSHVRPVHLQFETCAKSPGLCTFPSALVLLTQKQQLLMVGQPYKVVVELEVPESPQNQEAGMFLVCGELRDSLGATVDRACRSAILHYKSLLHRLLSTVLYFPFLISGSAEEKQMISVELFSGFTENPNHPATAAYIEIQSRYVQIYQTYLKIHAHFTGLRYFMFHWPVLAATLGVSVSFFFLGIITFLSWYKFFVLKQTVIHVGYDADAAKAAEERRQQNARNKEKDKASSEDEPKPSLEQPPNQDEKDKIEEDDTDANGNGGEGDSSQRSKNSSSSSGSDDFEVIHKDKGKVEKKVSDEEDEANKENVEGDKPRPNSELDSDDSLPLPERSPALRKRKL